MKVLTVELPTLILEVVKLTLEPILTAVATLADALMVVLPATVNIADNPGTADGSGYMLLQSVSMAGAPLVEITPSVFTPADYYPNSYLSWSWLIKNYYKYFFCRQIYS
jgi:hypothetical protein